MRDSATFTYDEVALMVAICCQLDENRYESNETKALILKCKATIEEVVKRRTSTFRIVN